MKLHVSEDVELQFTPVAPVLSLGWILALIALILVIVFFFVGVPSMQVLLLLVGIVALARLI